MSEDNPIQKDSSIETKPTGINETEKTVDTHQSVGFDEIMMGLSQEDRDQVLARAKRGQELCEMLPIMSQMPFIFPGSHYKINEFKGDCGFCKMKIGDQFLRGRIEMGSFSVAYVEAIGLCEQCLKCTRYEYRLHDDGSITGVVAGRWQRWQNAKGMTSTNSNQSNSSSPSAKQKFFFLVLHSFFATLLFLPYLMLRWMIWALTKPRDQKIKEKKKDEL